MAAFMINDTCESMYAISWMPDYYDRDGFNTFLDMFESDIRTSISNYPSVLDFVM